MLQALTLDDRPALCAILQDDRTMIHYGGAFDEAMTDAWLKRQLDRYEPSGIGLWAVIRKSDGVMIGQCGLTWQPGKTGRCWKSDTCSTGSTGLLGMRQKRQQPAVIWHWTGCRQKKSAASSGIPMSLRRKQPCGSE